MTAPASAVERVAAYLCDGLAPIPGDETESRLAVWLAASKRFLAFAEANRDKIRKKLRVASEPGARGDVRAELQAAFAMLADRRVELAFEAYGSGQRGPDFTVTFRASHRFNLEITRPRNGSGEPGSALAGALLGKLRQLPVDAPNALLIASGVAGSDEDVAAAVRALKARADSGEEEYFASRGLTNREFQVLHRRLALLLVGSTAGTGVFAWLNPEAKRRLPDGAPLALVRGLEGMAWGGG